MNLQEFINLRSHCPMCDTPLITRFISDRKQKSKIIENRYVAILVMRGMRSCEPDYEVGYSFGMEDDSLSIEFYNEWDMSASASNYMIKIFKDFHKNMAGTRFCFLRTCGTCYKYDMMSTEIKMDLKKATFSSMEVYSESFIFSTQVEDGFKFIKLDNCTDPKPSSELYWWRSEFDYRADWRVPKGCSKILDLPLIPFFSKEETSRRLNNLITFA